MPSALPTRSPSWESTSVPTPAPTPVPPKAPSSFPTYTPTPFPSMVLAPGVHSLTPSPLPTLSPSRAPSTVPTPPPTPNPSPPPSQFSSYSPTSLPSARPSPVPTATPLPTATPFPTRPSSSPEPTAALNHSALYETPLCPWEGTLLGRPVVSNPADVAAIPLVVSVRRPGTTGAAAYITAASSKYARGSDLLEKFTSSEAFAGEVQLHPDAVKELGELRQLILAMPLSEARE